MTPENSNPCCQALTKKGKPCRAAATDGGLCFFHANPKKAAELGRIGGRKHSRAPVETDPLHTLDNAMAVRDTVARVIADVYSGKIHPKIAAGLAPLLHLQLRALDATDMEGRISRLERLVTKRQQTSTKREFLGGNGVAAARDSEKAFEPSLASVEEKLPPQNKDNGPTHKLLAIHKKNLSSALRRWKSSCLRSTRRMDPLIR
jgi:hypothetical protein